jgi:hypothetical protein
LAAILAYQLLGVNGGYELAINALPLWFLSGAAASLAAIVADPLKSGPGPADGTRQPIRGASQ